MSAIWNAFLVGLDEPPEVLENCGAGSIEITATPFEEGRGGVLGRAAPTLLTRCSRGGPIYTIQGIMQFDLFDIDNSFSSVILHEIGHVRLVSRVASTQCPFRCLASGRCGPTMACTRCRMGITLDPLLLKNTGLSFSSRMLLPYPLRRMVDQELLTVIGFVKYFRCRD